MKQKYEGKRVINWHRPFRPGFDLRQRYLRNRYAELNVDDAEDTDALFHRHYMDAELEWELSFSAGDTDYLMQEARLRIMKGADWGQIRACLPKSWWSRHSASREETHQTPSEVISSRSQPLEEALAEHSRYLITSGFPEGRLSSAMLDAVQGGMDLDLLQSITSKNDNFVPILLIFAPFWVRPLSDWDFSQVWSPNRMISLVKHLFVYYPVPEFLYRVWLSPPVTIEMKWLYWFILLGQGGSLHRAAPHFNWAISRKFLHYLADVKSQVTLVSACMLAEIKRLGGSQIEFNRIWANRGYVVDPTDVSQQPSYLHFWRNAVRWLILHRDTLTDREANIILTWAMHQHTEAERLGGEPFSWQGRSPRRLFEAGIAYDARVSSYLPHNRLHCRWQGHGWDWDWTDESGGKWSFIELTSGLALFNEGKELHHCVGGYTHQCMAGSSAIVSLQYEGVPQITIEINPKTKKIVQIRGRYNRPPQVYEKTIVNQWMENVALTDTIT